MTRAIPRAPATTSRDPASSGRDGASAGRSARIKGTAIAISQGESEKLRARPEPVGLIGSQEIQEDPGSPAKYHGISAKPAQPRTIQARVARGMVLVAWLKVADLFRQVLDLGV